MTKLDTIQQTKLFEMLSRDELAMLSTLFQTRSYNDGELIFSQGDEGDGLYLLSEGQVEVCTGRGGECKVVAVLDPPEFFGEMSVIDKEFRSASVRARGATELYFLPVENLMAFRRSFRDGFTFVVINIARVISRRLRETTSRLSERL
ncbi:MAG: cyclic nucleotide-binding domain-containing protein [Deltaproteobacteria bacterium]|nr:cyclic nucleotide-binding domain-containing protein [Deltaproteobacteria bacterium]